MTSKEPTPPSKHASPNRGELITIDGESRTMQEWADLYEISLHVILMRHTRGWEWERAITTPVRGYNRKDST